VARRPAPAPAGDAGSTRYSTAIPDVTGTVVGVLVAVEGELEGEVYRIFDGENRLGRSSECEVALPSEWISRQHAMIIHQAGIFAIKPLTDRNATIVNDERIEGTELGDGALVKLGKTTFRFRSVV
jgi:pSer/pThr/pTyr-binding forkhead associated (FHA) protein